MIWTGIFEKEVTKVPFLFGKKNAIKYVTNLKDFRLPFVDKKHQGSYIFQQDIASIHCANVTKHWFQAQQMTVMDCPARSFCLNAMKNILFYSFETCLR